MHKVSLALVAVSLSLPLIGQNCSGAGIPMQTMSVHNPYSAAFYHIIDADESLDYFVDMTLGTSIEVNELRVTTYNQVSGVPMQVGNIAWRTGESG